MKRFLLILLCLLLVGTLSAMAEGANLDISLQGSPPTRIGDIYYTISHRPDKIVLLAYTLGQEVAVELLELPRHPAGIEYGTPFADQNEHIREALSQTVSSLFEWNGALWAINYHSGRLGQVDEQGLRWTEQRIDNAAYFEHGQMKVYGPGFAQDGLFVAQLTDYDDALDMETMNLLVSDLKGGTTRLYEGEHLIAVAPYKAGSLLLLRAAQEGGKFSYQLAELHLDSGEISPLPMRLPEIAGEPPTPIGAIGYDEGNDSFFYATAGKLYQSKAQGPFELIALLPFDYIQPGYSSSYPLGDGRLAVYSGSMLAIRQTGQAVDLSRTLTIQTTYLSPDFRQVFSSLVPDSNLLVENSHLTAAQAGQMVRSGEDSIDIFSLPADTALHAMINKGYAAALTDEALIADLGKLYPAARQVVVDGQDVPRAFPISFFMSTTYIQRETWQKYFGDKPYPTTYAALFDAMVDFNKRHASEDPEAYFLFDMDEAALLRGLLFAYIRQYETQDAPLDFDSPVLRDALGRMQEAVNIQRAAGQGPQEFEGENSGDIRNAPSLVYLFGGGGDPFRVPDTFGEHQDDIPPLTFKDGEVPLQTGQMHVLVINPNSKKQDLAQAFLSIYTKPDANSRAYYALRPGMNAPYPNPRFEEAVQFAKDDLAFYTKALEEALANPNATSEDKRIYQFRIDLANQDLADQDRLRYLIPAEGIARFRQIGDSIRYFERSLLLDQGPAQEQLNTLMERFLDGGSDLDTFLGTLNETARQVYQESR